MNAKLSGITDVCDWRFKNLELGRELERDERATGAAETEESTHRSDQRGGSAYKTLHHQLLLK
jgi:hypothetical protein